jgi:hypothetical protein
VHVPLPGSQVAPSATWHVPGLVHGETPPLHSPAWQVSPVVQLLPSLQIVPLGAFGFVHMPVPGLHAPTSWHWSSAVQVTGLPPVQTPAWQVSVCVHLLPSSQPVSSGAAGFEQAPVLGVQVPATWH